MLASELTSLTNVLSGYTKDEYAVECGYPSWADMLDLYEDNPEVLDAIWKDVRGLVWQHYNGIDEEESRAEDCRWNEIREEIELELAAIAAGYRDFDEYLDYCETEAA